MRTIPLATSGRETSQLGFGCSTLMGAMGRRASLQVLENAYEAGIRHYDVAPLYGYGEAESCVGEFRQRHADVTVTTKYGIPPPSNRGLVSALRGIAGPIVRKVPALKKSLSRAAMSVAASPEKASFSAEQARESLERSLRELRTGRIDLWLFHEAQAEDLRDEGLLRFCETAVQEGKIGAFGTASERARVAEMWQLRPEFCGVLQYEWSMFEDDADGGNGFRIYHRVLRDNFLVLREFLAVDAAAARLWSEEVGADLRDDALLASLVLKAALEVNSASVILVAAKNEKHLQQNVRVAADDALKAPAERLYALARREWPERANLVVAGAK